MQDARFDPTWHAATPSFGRRLLRTLARDLAIALLLLCATEIGLRVFLPGTRRYIHTPEITGGYPIERNSFELREREFPREPRQGEIRVLCLGNSTTWGVSVAVDDTYPRQLERLLAGHGDYFVINAGGAGSSVDKALDFLVDEGLSFRPSIVVLGFSPSMVSAAAEAQASTSAGPRPETTKPIASASRKPLLTRLVPVVRGKLRTTYSYVFWDVNVRKKLYGLGVLKDSVTAQSAATYAYAFDVPGFDLAQVDATYRGVGATIGRMRSVLAERGIRLVVMGIPSRFEISEERVDNERRFELERVRIRPLDRLGSELERLGIPYVNLLPRLRAERSAMLRGAVPWNDLYEYDYAHLNALGYRIASEALLAEMSRLGFVNQATSEARHRSAAQP